jgi:hypothetical protein
MLRVAMAISFGSLVVRAVGAVQTPWRLDPFVILETDEVVNI